MLFCTSMAQRMASTTLHRTRGRRRPDWYGFRSATGVVGETPNLAARLQAIAEPNTVTKIAGQSVRADAPRRIAARRECHARNLLGLVQFACLIVFC
jgi:hypothetical protein